MTREEYERLLKSDYWKGYSYALIKERYFTCEDCGRRFPNERNKLQVHHLVYRDASPWSYRPDEVIVLCEECHRRRHGIKSAPEQTLHDGTWGNPIFTATDIRGNGKKYSPTNRGCLYRFKYLLIFLIFIFVLMLIGGIVANQKTTNKKENNPSSINKNSHKTQKHYKNRSNTAQKSKDGQSNTTTNEQIIYKEEPPTNNNYETPIKADESEENLSTSELIERSLHADVVKDAKRMGLNTEGTTTEILQRINRKLLEETAQ